jgi:hypothetical protein
MGDERVFHHHRGNGQTVPITQKEAEALIGKKVLYRGGSQPSVVKSVRKLKENFYVGELEDGTVLNVHLYTEVENV